MNNKTKDNYENNYIGFSSWTYGATLYFSLNSTNGTFICFTIIALDTFNVSNNPTIM